MVPMAYSPSAQRWRALAMPRWPCRCRKATSRRRCGGYDCEQMGPMSSYNWPRSPFRRDVDRPSDESDTIPGNTAVRTHHLLTVGRFLFLFEIYLFVAT